MKIWEKKEIPCRDESRFLNIRLVYLIIEYRIGCAIILLNKLHVFFADAVTRSCNQRVMLPITHITAVTRTGKSNDYECVKYINETF